MKLDVRCLLELTVRCLVEVLRPLVLDQVREAGGLLPQVMHLVSGVRCQVSGVRCQVSGVRCAASPDGIVAAHGERAAAGGYLHPQRRDWGS